MVAFSQLLMRIYTQSNISELEDLIKCSLKEMIIYSIIDRYKKNNYLYGPKKIIINSAMQIFSNKFVNNNI